MRLNEFPNMKNYELPAEEIAHPDADRAYLARPRMDDDGPFITRLEKRPTDKPAS